jgi:hypothetical protein
MGVALFLKMAEGLSGLPGRTDNQPAIHTRRSKALKLIATSEITGYFTRWFTQNIIPLWSGVNNSSQHFPSIHPLCFYVR